MDNCTKNIKTESSPTGITSFNNKKTSKKQLKESKDKINVRKQTDPTDYRERSPSNDLIKDFREKKMNAYGYKNYQPSSSSRVEGT